MDTQLANVYITDFIRANGRLDYQALCRYAGKVSLAEFSHLFKRPLLVGSAIYDGNLQDAKRANQTMLFNSKDIEAAINNSDETNSFQTSIFPLYKRMRGDAKPNIITIGRSNENDLVLNDYPISREHAQIRIKSDRFFLVDNGATNSTTLNEKPLTANKEVEIKPGDTIAFGRYRFHFITPKALFMRIRK